MKTATALSEDDKYNIYKAEKILFGLGFSEEDLQKEPKKFFRWLSNTNKFSKTSFNRAKYATS